MVAIFYQDFGQSEGQTVDFVEVALQEQNTTGLVRNSHTIWQLWSCAKTKQNRLFVIVTGNTLLLTENHLPFICTLIINAVKDFVQDRFNY